MIYFEKTFKTVCLQYDANNLGTRFLSTCYFNFWCSGICLKMLNTLRQGCSFYLEKSEMLISSESVAAEMLKGSKMPKVKFVKK